jgi:hypothetical protein
MLEITVGYTESFDDEKQEFVDIGGEVVQLEHSLVSLSKWESLHEKAFLGKEKKSGEEVLSYVRCMMLDPNPPADILSKLSEKNVEQINAYIEAKKSATWFSEVPGAPAQSQETITSELVYYWMTVANIPWEAQYWHLNRLFTLIRICNVKNAKPKKQSRASMAQRRAELNAQRKRELNTTG